MHEAIAGWKEKGNGKRREMEREGKWKASSGDMMIGGRRRGRKKTQRYESSFLEHYML